MVFLPSYEFVMTSWSSTRCVYIACFQSTSCLRHTRCSSPQKIRESSGSFLVPCPHMWESSPCPLKLCPGWTSDKHNSHRATGNCAAQTLVPHARFPPTTNLGHLCSALWQALLFEQRFHRHHRLGIQTRPSTWAVSQWTSGRRGTTSRGIQETQNLGALELNIALDQPAGTSYGNGTPSAVIHPPGAILGISDSSVSCGIPEKGFSMGRHERNLLCHHPQDLR